MLPADPAARAGSTPEASGDSSSGTLAKYMDPLLERFLFVLLGSGLTLIAGFIRDRWATRRGKVSEVVKEYIKIIESGEYRDPDASRLTGMVRAGVPLLKDGYELDEFFREVSGRGFPHPWNGNMVVEVFPHMKPLVLLRGLAAEGRIFASDIDILEWLTFEVTKKRDDETNPPTN